MLRRCCRPPPPPLQRLSSPSRCARGRLRPPAGRRPRLRSRMLSPCSSGTRRQCIRLCTAPPAPSATSTTAPTPRPASASARRFPRSLSPHRQPSPPWITSSPRWTWRSAPATAAAPRAARHPPGRSPPLQPAAPSAAPTTPSAKASRRPRKPKPSANCTLRMMSLRLRFSGWRLKRRRWTRNLPERHRPEETTSRWGSLCASYAGRRTQTRSLWRSTNAPG